MQQTRQRASRLQQTASISSSAFRIVRNGPASYGRPRISVIVPVLQEEKILGKTLAIFTEELRRRHAIEIVVSDGGSTDGTLAIAERYADKIVQHTGAHRQTIAEGRNCGAAMAEGDVFIFLNGDTAPARPKEFFATVARWAAEHSSVIALACPVHIPPEERIAADSLFHGFYNTYVRALNACGVGMGRGECQVVRAEAFRQAGGYNPSIAAGEDFDLFRRLARTGTIRTFSDMLVYESPRRFRRYGYGRVLWSWTVNAVSVMVRKKAVSEEWEAVR